MDGVVVELGRFCRHGLGGGCPVCHTQKRVASSDTELEQAQAQITALNQQNMVMWYALQGIADGGCDPRGWAKEVLASVAKGTVSRGTG